MGVDGFYDGVQTGEVTNIFGHRLYVQIIPTTTTGEGRVAQGTLFAITCSQSMIVVYVEPFSPSMNFPFSPVADARS